MSQPGDSLFFDDEANSGQFDEGAHPSHPAGRGRHSAHGSANPDDGYLGSEITEFPGGQVATATLLHSTSRRGLERARVRKRRRRWLLLVLVLLVVALTSAAGYIGYRAIQTTTAADWSGPGTGSVQIRVNSGDGANAIGTTLVEQKVVASVDAFTKAAKANPKSEGIAPGLYQVRSHMSAAAAVAALVDPANHLVAKITIPEGTIEKDILTMLAAKLGGNTSISTVTAAAADIPNLGLPATYTPAGGKITSAEGFLFPDTYQFDLGMSPASALQQMVSEFTSTDHDIKFADGATAMKLTPYQALIIASMAQSEAKYVDDVPKVVRVILNRLAQNVPLKIDAASVYGAKVAGLDPTKVQYDTLNSPYNTYLHDGLPPTPISNPGEAVLQATVTPVDGGWLYYVNGDAQGHLAFYNTAAEFEVGRQRCIQNHWGCG